MQKRVSDRGEFGERLPIDKLQEMLLDPNVPQAQLRPYLMLDEAASGPFSPQVRVNPNTIQEAATESALALASLNRVSRFRRHMQYRRRQKRPEEVRIVSEGDSWFQFPFLLHDVIDELAPHYAILSFGAAGDLLTGMIDQDEFAPALIAEEPHAALLSAGGNDLLGGGRIVQNLEPFAPGRAAEDYVGPRFRSFLAARIADYRALLLRARQARPGCALLVHSYGYALPKKGRWLGRPFDGYGITDDAIQRQIVSLLGSVDGLTEF